MTETREDRQSRINQKIANLRAKAEKLQASADLIQGTINTDYAFWTQPAGYNAAGRAFANQRNRMRDKVAKAAAQSCEARDLSKRADFLESTGAVMAGDAAKARAALIASKDIQPGQMVDTTHYGIRKVLKVNRQTILVESAFGTLKVNKEFAKVVD